MAVVAVTNSNNRLADADTTTGWQSDGAGGAGPQTEPDLGYQLTSGSDYAVSRKIGTTKGGHAYVHGATVDMSAEANLVLMAKGVWYNSINAVAYPACGFRLGDQTPNHNEYAVIDDGGQGDLDADPKRLFYIIPIDPNVLAWPDIITGTPDPTAIDFFGIQGDFGGSAKAENVAMDAIDLVRGVGVLWLVGGDSTDPDGNFAFFVTHDEGTLTNRFGHIATVRDKVLEVFGKLWIGRTETPTATATVFKDSALTILFPAGFFDAGWTGIGIDLGSATTVVEWTDMVFPGLGQNNKKVYFDTITQVDPTPDEVTLVPAPGFITGTPVIYNNDGGSDTIGLTSGNLYWLEWVTDTTFNVHSSRDNARTGATPIALTDGSSGESHWFQRTPDIRPELEIVGTSGVFDPLRCTFDAWASLLLTSAATLTDCILRSCGLVDITTNNGGKLIGCGVSGQTTEPGEALVKTHSLVDIDDCDFSLDQVAFEAGHAIEIDTTGTYAFGGNLLAGYWQSPDNDNGAEFHTQTGVEPTTDVITTDLLHGFSIGEEVYYNDNGLSDTIGLTDGARYFVNVLSTTTFSLHRSKATAVADTNRIALTDGSTGQTQTFYSGNAAIVNTSGGLVTINVQDGTSPSVRNVGNVATAVVQQTVTLAVTVKEPNGGAVVGARVRIETSPAGALVSNGSTNGSGVYEDTTYNYTGDVAVKVIVRLKGFKDFDVLSSITVDGLSVSVSFQPDGTVDLP